MHMKKKYDKTKCWECGGKRIEKTDNDPNGVSSRYWECVKCGDKILDMDQLHEAAEKYRKLKRAHSVKISRWGDALAVRIPKSIASEQRLVAGSRALILPEKIGFKVIPEKD